VLQKIIMVKQRYALGKIVLSIALPLGVFGYGLPTSAVIPDRIASKERANACARNHNGGSLRQVVRAYQLAYTKYGLKPITIEYQPHDYGATIQYRGRMKNSKTGFEILTSLTVAASKDRNSPTGLDKLRIIICTPFPNTGNNNYYEADEQEYKVLLQKINKIEALVSKKYPITNYP
jgi:hypothetical protein